MTLSKSQRELILQKIGNIWKSDPPCPICSSPSWGVTNILEMKEFNEGNYCPGAAITPLVGVKCNTCSYTILFNAIALGIVDPETAKVKEAE